MKAEKGPKPLLLAIPTLKCPQMSSLIQSKYHMDTRECMKLIKLRNINDHKNCQCNFLARFNSLMLFLFFLLLTFLVPHLLHKLL